MSTSLLYHAFGLKGVKYISTEYENVSTMEILYNPYPQASTSPLLLLFQLFMQLWG